MKRAVIISLVAVLLIGTVALSAWAFGGPGLGAPGEGKEKGFHDPLNLTFDQQLKMLTIRQDFERDTLSLRFDLERKRLELRQLKAADPVNQAAVDAKMNEIKTLDAKLESKRKEMQEKTKGVFTADQLKKMEEMKESRKKDRGHGRPGGEFGGCFFK